MFGVKHFCELIRPKFSAPHSKPTLPPDPPPLPSPSLSLDCDSPPGVLAARAGRPPHVVGRRVSATLTQPPRAPHSFFLVLSGPVSPHPASSLRELADLPTTWGGESRSRPEAAHTGSPPAGRCPGDRSDRRRRGSASPPTLAQGRSRRTGCRAARAAGRRPACRLAPRSPSHQG